jgi:hypothetical protein
VEKAYVLDAPAGKESLDDGYDGIVGHLAARESFTPQEIASRRRLYNFGTAAFGVEEAPGVSVFAKDGRGDVFHTYSCYSRGLDILNPCAMARARRSLRAGARPPARGALALAATAWLLPLPRGAFAFAMALRAALDAREPHPRAPAFPDDASAETVLVAAGEPVGSHRLRALRVESLAADVAAFLHRADSGLDAAACTSFAAERGIDPAGLESVVKEFVAEGVLLRG